MELKELETLKMSGEDWNDLTNGERAWLIGQIMMHMNNEEAYYGDFLYIWPDGESWESCMSDFESDESYKELEESFKDNYKAYHEDGLYSHRDIPKSIVKAAHYWDEVLGLKPIVVLK
jgi:hypothetical protein